MRKTDVLNFILRSKSTILTFKEILIATGEKRPDLLKRRLNYYVKKGEPLLIQKN